MKTKEPRPLLSLGSTMLDLAISGKTSGALPKGTFLLLVGDSASGKTFISLSCLAEAMRSKAFADYRIIYGDEEGGAIMDWAKFFGQKVADKVEVVQCGTVEGFYYKLDDLIREGKPFIFIEDSMDALTSEDEEDKFQEQKRAFQKGKTTTGTYGTSKAKQNSSGIRQVLAGLRKTGSILIVICQTRDNIGFGAKFNPKTRGGGHALRFYSHVELWASSKGEIKKSVLGKPRQLGIQSKVKVKKNRVTGKLKTVLFPISWSLGIDNTRSMVDWMVEEGSWKSIKEGKIKAPEFGFEGSTESLVKQIEAKGQEGELKALVGETWSKIEEACETQRKPRYQ